MKVFGVPSKAIAIGRKGEMQSTTVLGDILIPLRWRKESLMEILILFTSKSLKARSYQSMIVSAVV